MRACVNYKSFYCKSFDFFSRNRCALSKESKRDSGARTGRNRNYAYYERKIEKLVEAPKGRNGKNYRGF